MSRGLRMLCTRVLGIAALAAGATLSLAGGEALAAGERPPVKDSATPGELKLERPTLTSLGFEWRIQGDANGNALGKVAYRKKGTDAWKAYLPLYRIGLGYKVALAMICNWPKYVIPDAVAGSIMDLEPGAEYEVRLTLQDPDGVEGEAVKTLTLRTRPEPVVPEEGPVRHVYPPDWKGEKKKPSFRNIMHAVNGYAPLCDCYQTVHPRMAAEPGTIIKMHAGVHKYDNQLYWENGPTHSYWQHGTITLIAKGTKEKPIYIVAAGDGEVIVDGNGCHNLFNLRSTDYLHFEGLTIRGTEIAFHCGFQGLRGGGMKGLTVKDCWIEKVVYGVLAQDGHSEDFCITDNVIIGTQPADRINSFGRSEGGYAAVLAGQGHVVCHNYVANFWDGINVFTSSHSDPQHGQQSRAIDFYNNDIHNCADQFIEADGSYANVRMLRNRCFNCPSQPLSVQPVFAGPIYWIRNIIWNAGKGKMAMKPDFGAQAYLFLHNTSSTHMRMARNDWAKYPEQSTWIIENNLSLGPKREKKAPMVVYAPGKASAKHQVGHNAFREDLPAQKWHVGKAVYGTLEELQAETGLDRNSLQIEDYSIFKGAAEPPHNARGAGFVLPQQVDLRLNGDAPIIDRAKPLPGINDGYIGEAPDIGAYEFGKPLPHYGPRTDRYARRLAAYRARLERFSTHPVSPKIHDVRAAGIDNQVEIDFSKPVQPASARNPEAYRIEPDVKVLEVLPGSVGHKVKLLTSRLEADREYTVHVKGVLDASTRAPAMDEQATFRFRRARPGLFCTSYGARVDVPAPAPAAFEQMQPEMRGVVPELRLSLRHPTFDDKGNAVGTFPAEHKNANFSMRFDGFLAIHARGDYTFHVSADDGAALYIDRRPVAWKKHDGTVSLAPGLHDLCLTYTQGTWGFGLKVEYQGPGIPRQEIPAEVLFHVQKSMNRLKRNAKLLPGKTE